MSALEAIEEERKNLLPTPQVSDMVQWFDRNQQQTPYAAIVTKIEAPGRVCLTIFKPNAFHFHKEGVRYISDPTHEQPNNPTTVRCGSWGYGDKPPKAAFDYHEKLLDQRELNFLKDQEAHEQAKQAKEERAAQKQTKKPIPELV